MGVKFPLSGFHVQRRFRQPHSSSPRGSHMSHTSDEAVIPLAAVFDTGIGDGLYPVDRAP